MKYFTKKWCSYKLSEEELAQAEKLYEQYINKIFDKLLPSIKVLTKSLSLHDGIIRNVIFNEKNKFLVLSGIFGDLEFGYYSLEIKYIHSFIDKELLTQVFFNKEVEIIRDEIEMLSDNQFSHSIIFSSKDDIKISFSNLEIKIIDTIATEYNVKKCKLNIIS
jgi:hypothetical protein